jgi:hypothetical protein
MNFFFVSILLLILVLYLKVIRTISDLRRSDFSECSIALVFACSITNNIGDILFGNFSICVSRKIQPVVGVSPLS